MLSIVVLSAVCAMAAPVLAAPPEKPADASTGVFPTSPCPDLFRYEENSPGRWTGSMLAASDEDLHGVWMRVLFGGKIKEITVEPDFDAVLFDSGTEALIKDKDFLLRGDGKAHRIKISVKYDGDKIPGLAGYRLNARMLCPEPFGNRTDYFKGDSDSPNFLDEIKAKTPPSNSNEPKRKFKCGVKSSDFYPWHAAIFFQARDGSDPERFVCEATLISAQHLLTAAHCVTFVGSKDSVPARNLVAHLGGKLVKSNVKKSVVFPGREGLSDDLAIVQLETPLEINDDVGPICLGGDLPDGLPSLIGYGIGKDGGLSGKVVEAKAKVLSDRECEEDFPDDFSDDETYCMSYASDNKNCAGGSGSAVISVNDSVATLRGFVTVGVALQGGRNCDRDKTVLVANVDRYSKWINSVLLQN